jgi:hypothetical protein
MLLAGRPGFRQSLGVRCFGVLVLLFAASSASAAPPNQSNPAFLGIEMEPAGDACVIRSVTNCSPAQDAGLRSGDFVVAMDGKPLIDPHAPVSMRKPSCDVLRERIITHAPGDVVSYDVRRGGRSVPLETTLSTRADVQHRCFVGQALPAIEIADVDAPDSERDLGELRGKTTVLAWFRVDRCVGCGAVLDKIADGLAKRSDGESPPQVIGITAYPNMLYASTSQLSTTLTPPKPTRTGFSSTLPLWFAGENDFRNLTLKENDRIQVMIVDCRGIVRFVAPLAPDSDDLEAAIDEVLAAAEQAEHQRTQRR